MKVMFVCTGNICRSPLGEAILKKLTKESGKNIFVSSSGTESYHEGEKPDYRALKIGKKYNLEMENIRAKKITLKDIQEFDYIFCASKKHSERLKKLLPFELQHKIHLFLEFTKVLNKYENELPDPYYGTDEDFEEVYELCLAGCKNFINFV